MKIRKLILFLLASGISFPTLAQNNPVSHIRHETIRIIDTASGFKSTIRLQSIPSKNSKNFFIHYISLEKVTDYDIRYLSEKGKWKLFRKADTRDFQVTGDAFYTCERSLSIELPAKGPFQVNYEMTSSDLILQSNLLFYDRFPVDTFYYEIYIPNQYHLRTQLLYPEKLQYFRTDSVPDKKGVTYFFTGVPKNRDGINSDNEDYNVREHRCMMLTAVVPQSFAGNETRYFTDWMLQKIRSKTVLNDASRRLIDSVAGPSSNKDSVTCALYNYFRDHIKYISVEIGYGAFVPHDVNKTLSSRQGDCKDMASLLCEALRTRGVEAWLAVASTHTHNSNMTFPSLSGGNHMICVVKHNDNWLFLDPTNKSGTCWLTGDGIQGRTVLVLNNMGGTFVSVPPALADQNRERITILLSLSGDTLAGTLNYTARGAAMQYLKSRYDNTPRSEWGVLSRDFLSNMMAGTTFSSAEITQTCDSLMIHFSVKLSPSVFTRNGNTIYLSLGFLPSPMEFVHGGEIGGDIILGHTVLRETDIRIETGTIFQPAGLKPLQYDQDGYQYSISARITGQTVNIHSHFRCDNITISDVQLPAYKSFSSFVSTSQNYAVSFK